MTQSGSVDDEGGKIEDGADIAFVQKTIDAIKDDEVKDGGPRLGGDLVTAVRNLVRASATIQKSTITMQETVQSLVTVIEGKSFGDRTDGLLFRIGRLERRQALALVIVGFIAARIGFVEYPTLLRILGMGH